LTWTGDLAAFGRWFVAADNLMMARSGLVDVPNDKWLAVAGYLRRRLDEYDPAMADGRAGSGGSIPLMTDDLLEQYGLLEAKRRMLDEETARREELLTWQANTAKRPRKAVSILRGSRPDGPRIPRERRSAIGDRLSALKALQKCTRCQASAFTMANGYFVFPVQTDLDAIEIGGTTVPAVAVVCNQCGLIYFHSLGAIDMLEDEEQEK
jgi:hypothetical protein